jgi:hypothetical protein
VELGISKLQALEIARRYVEEKGWRVDNLRAEWTWRYYIIWQANVRGPALFQVRKSDGVVETFHKAGERK